GVPEVALSLLPVPDIVRLPLLVSALIPVPEEVVIFIPPLIKETLPGLLWMCTPFPVVEFVTVVEPNCIGADEKVISMAELPVWLFRLTDDPTVVPMFTDMVFTPVKYMIGVEPPELFAATLPGICNPGPVTLTK